MSYQRINDLIYEGNIAFVKKLVLENVSENDSVDEYFKMACAWGRLEIAKFLVNKYKVEDETFYDSLILTTDKGYNEITKWLVNDLHIHPGIYSDAAMCNATFWGNFPLVEFLLKDRRVSPVNGFCNAAGNGFNDIVYLLLEDGRVNPLKCKCNEEPCIKKCSDKVKLTVKNWITKKTKVKILVQRLLVPQEIQKIIMGYLYN